MEKRSNDCFCGCKRGFIIGNNIEKKRSFTLHYFLTINTRFLCIQLYLNKSIEFVII